VIRKLKFFVVFAMLALVPLRALAAVTVGLCAAYDGGSPSVEHAAHHHGASSGDASSHDDGAGSPSVCSLCTACCAGASFAAVAPTALAIASARVERIPFFGQGPGGHLPDQLDRPPLSR
jgi:hypothetical protein